MLLLAGLFAVTGSPPFGMFLSEFTIVRAAWEGGHPWIATVALAFLALIFIGIASMILGMLYGERASPSPTRPVHEGPWLLIGPATLAFGALVLGVVIPGPLQDLLTRAAAALEVAGP
jgi:hydrogenase-4 component F